MYREIIPEVILDDDVGAFGDLLIQMSADDSIRQEIEIWMSAGDLTRFLLLLPSSQLNSFSATTRSNQADQRTH